MQKEGEKVDQILGDQMPRRKRGRPPKSQSPTKEYIPKATSAGVTPKKSGRGRPRKTPSPTTDEKIKVKPKLNEELE